MKKVIITLIILVASIAAANAQFFVEGSIGASYRGGTSSLDGITKDNPSSYSLRVTPLVGYRLNENLALGVKASLIKGTQRSMGYDPDTGDEIVHERKISGWSLSVFDRYKLWGTKKFSLLVESSVYISKSNNAEKTGTITIWNNTATAIGVTAFPLISYDLSDKWSFTFTTNLLRVDLYAQTVNDKDTGIKTKSAHLDFNGQTTVFNSLGGISIGIPLF